MIKGIDICKKFGEHIIFDHYSFKIDTGEFVCFAGASGTGKTTLLHIIGLIEEFDLGRLLIDHKEITKRKDKLLYYRQKVCFLFQNFALIEGKTVRQNLNMIKAADRTKGATIESVLEKVGLSEKIDEKIYTLSGGEQQRIALARVFLKRCEIVLADEPTGSLDKENARKVVGLLKELHKEGKTVVLVTHDEEIQGQCERIIRL